MLSLPLEAHAGLKDLKVEKLLVAEGNRVAGQSPRTLDLAETKGISILAIRWEEYLLVHRLADTAFTVGDLVYCIGND